MSYIDPENLVGFSVSNPNSDEATYYVRDPSTGNIYDRNQELVVSGDIYKNPYISGMFLPGSDPLQAKQMSDLYSSNPSEFYKQAGQNLEKQIYQIIKTIVIKNQPVQKPDLPSTFKQLKKLFKLKDIFCNICIMFTKYNLEYSENLFNDLLKTHFNMIYYKLYFF